MKTVAFVTLILAVFVVPCAGAAPSSETANGRRDLTVSEAGRAMSYVYEGKSRAAVVFVDSLAPICDGEPFYLLIKSRVAREMLTVDDENKERLQVESEPIHRDLERVIEVCTERMDAAEEAGDEIAEPDPRLRLYRGLAWMSKAHLCSFARRFWCAGRDAKKGKSDLEAYLRIHPDEPLALGTMGVFLYFADTIPRAFKYLSKLLFLPTGDREKGLRYIKAAAAMESVLQTDFQVVQSTVDLLFEGRYEDGLDGTVALLERWPSYPRLALPLALMQPFDPVSVARSARLIDATLERFEDAENLGEAERYSLALLSFLDAYANRFVAPPDLAEDGLYRVANSPYPGPDWCSGYAAFELGRMLASEGRDDDAREAFDWVRHNAGVSFLRGDAKQLAEALDGPEQDASVVEPAWITEVYFGTPEERSVRIRDFESAPSVSASFYLADALLLSGRADEALEVIQEVLDRDVEPWDEEFHMLAASRAAEIHGLRGDYDAAVQMLDRAMEFYRKEFLVDWILEGRKRYYQRLRDGEALPTPRLLSDPR
jgi:tetratricopeptide (TPR) repeat protein